VSIPRRAFPVHRLSDGRAMVNLGSSTRTAPGWTNIDSSPILRLGRHRRLSRALWLLGLLSEYRYSRIRRLDGGCVVWNLARGIPYPDRTFDVVYHSHLLEHIDREQAPAFVAECFRVLKPGGAIRIVVPDLELLGRAYVKSLDGADPASDPEYDVTLEQMFEQMVPRTPALRRQQPLVVRILENLFVGDTARCGTLHRWMYDRFSLERLLRQAGFGDIVTLDHRASRIPGWESFRLDIEGDGSAYKPGSLYVEATRPQ
jgi:SAM-dependent methyltransferase